MADELDEYLQVGSPFLREVDLSLLNAVIRDLFLEQDYDVSQALAKPLILIEATSVLGAISKNPGKYVPTTQEQLRRDMAEYYIGFTRPFRLLQLASLARQTGLEQAKKLHSRLSAENAERYFLHENLSFALTLLRADPSGVRFITRLVQKEVAASTNLYYKVGLEAARRIFLEYTEILAILHPNVEYKEEKDLTSLLARLTEYEKTAPLSPQSQPINPTLKQIEEVLVKSAEEQSLWKAVEIGFFLFFKLLLRQPRRIRTLFTVLLRSIRALHKNPSATMQRWERVDDMLLTIRELAQQIQQPGEVLTQLHPELTDFVESTFPYPSYPAKNLVRDLQRIRTLNGVDTEEASEQLLEEWARLAEQRDLPSHPALWTAICMALGDFALKKQLFGVAKRAYAKPLGKSVLWRSDLGTRYVCAAKLGELYCEHGSNLEMSTSQLARALHDVYLDMLRVNERLYQRSPYQDSKRKLQARNDFIMARALEACVYLSMHCEEAESVQWRREAFVIAESGKSRMLREEMALAERLPPKEMPAHLCGIEERCLAHLRAIYAEIATRRTGRSFEEFQAERNELRLDLEQTWAEMEDHGDEARAYVVARRDEALQWEGLQWDSFQRVAEHLGEQFAIVSISMLPESVLLSVLRSGWEAPRLCRVSLSQNDLQDRYLESYEKEILNRKPSEKVFLKHEWQRLGDVLFAPLEPLLDGVNYVYFLPHGKIHKLPLHALTIRDEPFIKHWGVAYAPSIRVLESTLSRPKRQGPVLVMGYADPNDPRKTVTKFILEEAKKIAAFFHSPYMLPEAVNAQILRKEGQPASIIHLACHGIFTAKDPLNSGVVLADGTFTARDWLQLQLQADLVTLSACQVGISDIRPGDDLVGLTRSILFAGAASLLMTLWSVDSKATYDWMLLFYQNLQKNDAPARKIDAFKNATLALLEEYNDPYYWAPFVLVGHP